MGAITDQSWSLRGRPWGLGLLVAGVAVELATLASWRATGNGSIIPVQIVGYLVTLTGWIGWISWLLERTGKLIRGRRRRAAALMAAGRLEAHSRQLGQALAPIAIMAMLTGTGTALRVLSAGAYLPRGVLALLASAAIVAIIGTLAALLHTTSRILRVSQGSLAALHALGNPVKPLAHAILASNALATVVLATTGGMIGVLAALPLIPIGSLRPAPFAADASGLAPARGVLFGVATSFAFAVILTTAVTAASLLLMPTLRRAADSAVLRAPRNPGFE